jgi:membrane-associated phospholipid phosphatase
VNNVNLQNGGPVPSTRRAPFQPWLAPAEHAGEALERAALICFAVASWFSYFLVGWLLNHLESTPIHTPLDAAIPFWPPAEYVYALAYPFGFLPAFQIRDLSVLRRYVGGFAAMQLVACALFVLLPIRMERATAYDPSHSFAEWAIALNYGLDKLPLKCFPSLHVANACFTAQVARWLDERVGRWALLVAAAISLSTLLVKQHYAADVLGGVLLAYGTFAATFGRWARPRGPLTFPRRWLWGVPAVYGLMAAGAALYRAHH